MTRELAAREKLDHLLDLNLLALDQVSEASSKVARWPACSEADVANAPAPVHRVGVVPETSVISIHVARLPEALSLAQD